MWRINPAGAVPGHPWPPRHLCFLHIARHARTASQTPGIGTLVFQGSASNSSVSQASLSAAWAMRKRASSQDAAAKRSLILAVGG